MRLAGVLVGFNDRAVTGLHIIRPHLAHARWPALRGRHVFAFHGWGSGIENSKKLQIGGSPHFSEVVSLAAGPRTPLLSSLIPQPPSISRRLSAEHGPGTTRAAIIDAHYSRMSGIYAARRAEDDARPAAAASPPCRPWPLPAVRSSRRRTPTSDFGGGAGAALESAGVKSREAV